MTAGVIAHVLSATCLLSAVARGGSLFRRVVNGETMTRGEWPFLVSLHYLKPHPLTEHTHMRHVCGGSLIHPRWVLTAAHCIGMRVDTGRPVDWAVVLGEHNQYLRDFGETTVAVQAFFIHPGFRPNVTHDVLNDVALVLLDRPAAISPYVGVVGLHRRGRLRDSMKCQVGGWGQASAEPYGWGMYIPMRTTVYTLNQQKCAAAYEQVNRGMARAELHLVVDHTVICAGQPPSSLSTLVGGASNDACYGDSGSPLLCRTGEEGEYQVTGVVSAGLGCGAPQYAGIYTRVASFVSWIDDIIAQHNIDVKVT